MPSLSTTSAGTRARARCWLGGPKLAAGWGEVPERAPRDRVALRMRLALPAEPPPDSLTGVFVSSSK
ncbi:MAG: hypothetical protein IPG17_08465 [Sandaracinaceae bacterium]|nr:hypothetical protein [Sandaracinaceae bacterium]MBP7681791.1 hypothetical protein [Deltaproteobacteria bacterium]MBK7152784.1 hypothetical protein [Sandaracinaceae bacterium]MBK7774012.1 hypothetical protein [Sandaracinaceae bacterium]MBK8412192.1 hypothetical protein [Sandaracinaceae bacterium]